MECYGPDVYLSCYVENTLLGLGNTLQVSLYALQLRVAKQQHPDSAQKDLRAHAFVTENSSK